jgi:hypothetical protein
VRLFDHGTAEEPQSFDLPASVVPAPGGGYQPVPCSQTAVFGHVSPPHKYSALVEAYDRTDLRALAAGSSILVDGSGKYVPPRWTTRCGRDEAGNPITGAVVSAQYVTRFVRGCEPLATTGPETDTAITLSVSDVEGATGCGSGAGQIERFAARLQGNLASTQEAACGETIVFAPLTAGAPYSFELLAFEGGQTEPSLGTTCFRIALGGATVSADCDPLRSEGALEVDVDELIDAWGASCGAGGALQSITATISPTPDGVTPINGCSDLRFDALPPGPYTLNVTSSRWDETPGPGAVCSGSVDPGLVSRASCTPLPVNP